MALGNMKEIPLILQPFGDASLEYTLGTWKVQNGAIIKEAEILVELETDKAIMEFASPLPKGSMGILRIDHASGSVLRAGAQLGVLEVGEITYSMWFRACAGSVNFQLSLSETQFTGLNELRGSSSYSEFFTMLLNRALHESNAK